MPHYEIEFIQVLSYFLVVNNLLIKRLCSSETSKFSYCGWMGGMHLDPEVHRAMDVTQSVFTGE